MATFGEIRFRISKQAPGVDADLIDGWINDRYSEILDQLPWQRQDQQSVLQTVAVYETGTLAATNGSNAVTGTGTTWASAMTGRAIRINDSDEYYEFTFVSATSGTLDRPYEGSTASGLSYKISASVFQLPSNLRILREMRVLNQPRPLDRWTQAQLNQVAPNRTAYGTPEVYVPFMDDGSSPPRAQVELYPIPDTLLSVPYWYTFEPATFAAADTALTLLPWLRPGALIAGVMVDVKMHLEDYVGADEYGKLYASRVMQLVGTDNRNKPARQVRMAPRFTRHRLVRALRGNPGSYRRLP